MKSQKLTSIIEPSSTAKQHNQQKDNKLTFFTTVKSY